MPPVAAAVTGAMMWAGVAAGTAEVIGDIAAALALTAANGFVGRLMSKKPDMRLSASVSGSIQPRRTIYGEVTVPGVPTYAYSNEESGWLEQVYTLAGHECEEVGQLYLNDQAVTYAANGSGTGKYVDRLWYHRKRGAPDELAFPVQSTNNEWTANHRQDGCASAYLSLRRSGIWNGLPTAMWAVKGKNDIRDPRVSLTGYGNNAALCYRDYLVTPRRLGGLGVDPNYINEDEFIAAANICDESATTWMPAEFLRGAARYFGSPYTVHGVAYEYVERYNEWDIYRPYTADVSLRSNLSAWRACNGTGTQGSSDTLFSLPAGYSPSYDVLIASDYPLVVNVQVTGKRYTCNGVYIWDKNPEEIMAGLLSAFGGIPTYANGKHGVLAAAWRTPSDDVITEDDLRSASTPIVVRPLLSMRDLVNGIKGTYISAQNRWQPSDYPPAKNAAYVTADGGFERWGELSLPFTSDPAAATRLARIELEKRRRQITVELKGNLGCIRYAPGDVVKLSLSDFDWTEKTFEVNSTRIVSEPSGDDGASVLGIDMTLRETDINVYASAIGGDGVSLIVPYGPATAQLDWEDQWGGGDQSFGNGTVLIAFDGNGGATIEYTGTKHATTYINDFGVNDQRLVGVALGVNGPVFIPNVPAPGQELIAQIFTSAGRTFVSGPATRNADGFCHAHLSWPVYPGDGTYEPSTPATPVTPPSTSTAGGIFSVNGN